MAGMSIVPDAGVIRRCLDEDLARVAADAMGSNRVWLPA